MVSILFAAPAAADDWTFAGDLRAGYLANEVRARDGVTTTADSLRLRARLAAGMDLAPDWQLGIRAAALVDSGDDDFDVWLRRHAPGPTGLATGQATIDSLFVDYQRHGAPWRLRLGRFQTSFVLAGVASKSLDRADSPSFNVGWTDGVWLRRRTDAWTGHLVAQHNDRRGTGNAARPPLSFGASGARVSMFAGMEANAALGPVVQRMFGLTWLPSALPGQSDYLALTARGAAEWPLGASTTRLLLAAEVGHAPNTPRRVALGTGGGDAKGTAWQASVNLIDFAPAHSIGFLYGRVSDGWLISSNFRPNESMAELRWAWQVRADWNVEARIRRRLEIDLPYAGLHARRTDDLYLRTTYRF